MTFCLRAFITKFKFKIGIKEQYSAQWIQACQVQQVTETAEVTLGCELREPWAAGSWSLEDSQLEVGWVARHGDNLKLWSWEPPNVDLPTELNIADLLAQTSSLYYSCHLAHLQLSDLNHIQSKINTGFVKKAISQITPYVTIRGQA